jgi:hypothetical protein
MICRNCGSYNPDGNFFCGKCGGSLQAKESASGEEARSSEKDEVTPPPLSSESNEVEPGDDEQIPQEELPWEKYCIYCKFKDKLLPSGDSYCSVCEQKAIESQAVKPDVAVGGSDEEPKVKIQSEVFIPDGRRTSRLKARMRERESARLFYEKVPKTAIAVFIVLLLAALIVYYVLGWQENERKAEAGKKYLKVSDRLIKDYNKAVRKVGEIGSEVYLPDAGTFDERRENALAEIRTLKEEVKADYDTAKETKTGNEDLEPLKDDIVKAYGALLRVDLPELEDFTRTVDVTIIRAMMEGSFSRSSFNGAVSISEEASSAIKDAIELWHKEENKLD